jgi:hypothetical protein
MTKTTVVTLTNESERLESIVVRTEPITLTKDARGNDLPDPRYLAKGMTRLKLVPGVPQDVPAELWDFILNDDSGRNDAVQIGIDTMLNAKPPILTVSEPHEVEGEVVAENAQPQPAQAKLPPRLRGKKKAAKKAAKKKATRKKAPKPAASTNTSSDGSLGELE